MENVNGKKNLSPVYVLAVLAIGVFIAQLDATIFVPALNSVVSEFNTSFEWVIWSITIYMLAFTITMPLAGKISDLFGRKKLYIAGVGIFCIGSLACGFAWDIPSLLAFRILQAVGGGMILPAALAEIGIAVPEKSRGMAMGIMMAINAVAAIIGPNLGGFIVENFGWRYVFYINPPIGIIAILLALKFTETYGDQKHSIDFPGALLLGVALLSFMFGVIRLEALPFTDITVFPLFIIAGVLLVLLIIVEKRSAEPILSIPLLARTDVLALNFAALAFGFCFFTVVLYVPSYSQMILGLGIQESGSILTPLTVSVLIMAILGGILADRFGVRSVLLTGTVFTCITLFAMAFTTMNTTILAIILMVMGIGVGFCMGSFQTLMLALTPRNLKGSASGIVNTFMNIGGIIGPTVGSYYIANATKKLTVLKLSMPAGSETATTGGTMPPFVLAMMRDIMGPAFHEVYLLAALVSLATIILVGIVVLKGYVASEARSPVPEAE